jgi:WD40 repeat protein
MLWDVKNKNSTKTIEGHASPVTAVASGSSDQLVLSAGQDKTLVLHSLSSSHSLQNTVNLSTKDTAEQGVISRLRFSVMDRAVAASASDSGCVCLWSVESQRLLHKFPSSGPATDLSFAQSNNKLLVSVGEDCKIHFLDTQQRKEVMLVSTPSPLSSVAILRDGYTVAAGGVDGKLYVYELRAMKSPKHVLEAHQGAITCIAEQNSVKSSRSSMKKAKKSAKESSRLSSLTPSDSPATPADPPNNQHTHPAPTTTTPSLETSPPPLPQQPPPLTLASHVVAPSSRVPTLPHQTPFPAGQRGSVQWGQFTTPAQTAGDKDSTGTTTT